MQVGGYKFWLQLLVLVVPLSLLMGCGGSDSTVDPLVSDYPLAYIKRPLPTDSNGVVQNEDTRQYLDSIPGGDVYVRDYAASNAPERNITAELTKGPGGNNILDGDVRDLAVSYDGTKLLFSLRKPVDTNLMPQLRSKWDIYEYEFKSHALRRVINTDTIAQAGHDLAPQYLPDGRILFVSTRQNTLWTSRFFSAALEQSRTSEAAAVLHIMNADGTSIKQISFNQSHDFSPTVLQSGRILFSRWDNLDGVNAYNLYSVNPDGTDLKIVYGAHSHNTGTNNGAIQFLNARELPDGEVIAIQLAQSGTFRGGDLLRLDLKNYADANQPTWPNQSALSGNGQVSLISGVVTTAGQASPGGLFRSVAPLWDGTNRALVSWSPCLVIENSQTVLCTPTRLSATTVQLAPAFYSIYMMDLATGSRVQLVRPAENEMIAEAVVAQPRTAPMVIYDKVPGSSTGWDTGLAAQTAGVLHIRSVYDFDGSFNARGGAATSLAQMANPSQTTPANRPARFMRFEAHVGTPDSDIEGIARTPAYTFGRASAMRSIIGYARIEPDGSVMTKLPANVPISFSVLDSEGRRLGTRHRNWLTLKPGETLNCVGCHNHTSGLPHGTPDGPTPINAGAVSNGAFPGASPTLLAQTGETMAQTRMRIACTSGQDVCNDLKPSVNLVFVDDWSTPTPATAYSYLYSDLTTTQPSSNACQTSWTPDCRTVINYYENIHPLWSLTRGAAGADTCTNCHNVVDINNANIPMVPKGQLDLTSGLSADNNSRCKSYQELFFPDNEQELVGGVLTDRLVDQTITNADGSTTIVQVPVSYPASMSASGARASYFMEKMLNIELNAGRALTGSTNHAGMMSAAELRLVAEWLDAGGQYYNQADGLPATPTCTP